MAKERKDKKEAGRKEGKAGKSGHGFLFLADVHVKTRTWTNFPKVKCDAYAALETLSEALVERFQGQPEECVDTLVVGGDWFDSNRPCSLDYQETRRFLGRFRKVFFIRGNHDGSEPAWLGGLDNAVELDARKGFLRMFEDDDAWIAGVSWQANADRLKESLAPLSEEAGKLAGRKYVVLHAPFRELLGFEGAWQLSLEDLECFNGTGTVFLVGDVHARHTRSFGDGLVFHSPGALYPLGMDCLGTPCFATLVEGGGAIRDVPVPSRTAASGVFQSMEDLQELCSRLVRQSPQAGHIWLLQPLVLLEIPQKLAGAFRPEELPQGVLVQPRAVSEELPAACETVPADTLEDAVREELSNDSDLADMAASLLCDDDPVGTASSWLDQWGVVRTDG